MNPSLQYIKEQLLSGKNINKKDLTYIVGELITASENSAEAVDAIDDGLYSSWVPTQTGFSVPMTIAVARYKAIGKQCHAYVTPAGTGTSNATTFTITLPFAGASEGNQAFQVRIANNGVYDTGLFIVTAGSNIATFFATQAGGAFTNSGAKYGEFNIVYEID